MTIHRAHGESVNSPDNANQPALTEKQAVKNRICSKRVYRRARAWFDLVVVFHLGSGRIRAEREPQPMVGHEIAKPCVERANKTLKGRLEADVDPLVDDIRADHADARDEIATCQSWNATFTTAETRTTRSISQAIAVEDSLTTSIQNDTQAGLTCHRRTSSGFRALAKKLPYLEGIGAMVFLAFYMNIDWTDPLSDILAWSAAVVIVIVAIWLQSRKVNNGASDHNHAREHRGRRNLHAADASEAKRNRNLIIATVISLVLTGGLVLRATSSTDLGISLFVITALAIVAGFGMPILAFIAVAFDGSSLSRERDELVRFLDGNKASYDMHKSRAGTLIDRADDVHKEILQAVVPAIRDATDDDLEPARHEYSLVRLLLGLPEAKPPSSEAAAPGALSTRILGADDVDLRSLRSRGDVLQHLLIERNQLSDALAQIPEHPWTRPLHSPDNPELIATQGGDRT